MVWWYPGWWDICRPGWLLCTVSGGRRSPTFTVADFTAGWGSYHLDNNPWQFTPLLSIRKTMWSSARWPPLLPRSRWLRLHQRHRQNPTCKVNYDHVQSFSLMSALRQGSLRLARSWHSDRAGNKIFQDLMKIQRHRERTRSWNWQRKSRWPKGIAFEDCHQNNQALEL